MAAGKEIIDVYGEIDYVFDFGFRFSAFAGTN
jgi:hypothetical protein